MAAGRGGRLLQDLSRIVRAVRLRWAGHAAAVRRSGQHHRRHRPHATAQQGSVRRHRQLSGSGDLLRAAARVRRLDQPAAEHLDDAPRHRGRHGLLDPEQGGRFHRLSGRGARGQHNPARATARLAGAADWRGRVAGDLGEFGRDHAQQRGRASAVLHRRRQRAAGDREYQRALRRRTRRPRPRARIQLAGRRLHHGRSVAAGAAPIRRARHQGYCVPEVAGAGGVVRVLVGQAAGPHLRARATGRRLAPARHRRHVRVGRLRGRGRRGCGLCRGSSHDQRAERALHRAHGAAALRRTGKRVLRRFGPDLRRAAGRHDQRPCAPGRLHGVDPGRRRGASAARGVERRGAARG